MRLAAFGLLATLLTACSAPVPLAIGPAIQEPELLDDAMMSADGARLIVRPTLPEGTDPQMILVAVHGMNDYGNFIRDAARYFAKQGIATYAYDQRGFGDSPRKGRWYGRQGMTDDLSVLVRLIASRHPGKPIYVLGESMGGAVTMLADIDGKLPGVSGLILSAPAVWGRSTMGFFPRNSLWIGGRLFPWFEATGEGLNITPSDNIAMLRALGRDPLVIKRTRIGTIYGLVDLMDEALDEAGNGTKPTLFLYGTKDEIIPPTPTCRALRQFKERHTSAPWRVAVYRDGYHMLLRDLGAEKVWADIATWMRDRSAALPSGAEATDRPDTWPGCARAKP
ncbi:alpha/beta hydrolase [Lacibacterium aquatile]|uniref:Alpha/beta hydrolase n=1 Tax=Lacibacterium aquatile TaxID=1168082 RepID=A0ABW5DMP5_9PROT